MYWFLLFLGVVVVWLVVLALLAKKLWGQTKALARELAAAQTKLETAQRSEAEGPELRVGTRA
jgi:cell division protein FtsB